MDKSCIALSYPSGGMRGNKNKFIIVIARSLAGTSARVRILKCNRIKGNVERECMRCDYRTKALDALSKRLTIWVMVPPIIPRIYAEDKGNLNNDKASKQ